MKEIEDYTEEDRKIMKLEEMEEKRLREEAYAESVIKHFMPKGVKYKKIL